MNCYIISNSNAMACPPVQDTTLLSVDLNVAISVKGGIINLSTRSILRLHIPLTVCICYCLH